MTTEKIQTTTAMVLEQIGGNFIKKTIDLPTIESNQVKIEIYASGINPLDTKIWLGQAEHAKQLLPAVLGMDLAGKVVEKGNNVTRFEIGDEVFGLAGGVGGNQGTLARFIVVDEDLLAKKPINMNMVETAALPLIFITAWEGLVDRAKVDQNKTVFIQAGAGGVGHMAIQIAKAFRATVYATAFEKDYDLIRSYGATPISFAEMESGSYIDTYTNGKGFDIVFDTLGGTFLDAAFKAVKIYTGHVVTSLGWGTHALAPLSFRGATYSGVFTLLPLITGKGKAHHGDILSEATRLVESGKLNVRLHPGDYNFDNIDEAHSIVRQGKAKGKVVVHIK
ncbi:zinc-dependent alcohol dehydrogenase family protein [Chryseobacterium paridis]|uniref:Zinc-dependent alcohol dehydrogenase family protein n=1 Tax=Chryseobacterium paridis TaxID=2800328 RepID=A0ABS1FZH2_9FLAO|nr:zinc-dependent alcohol dehydrogenase family protein [Chryseobacterium paridis]MBK1897800.1 zinc-dependent alcohol dehydrogenase family protein [Chryseobacterium paridis]